MSPHTFKRSGAGLLALALGLTTAACGSTVSTGNFKGESHAVAQAIASFQRDATAGDQKKICQNDLARSVQERLKSGGDGCLQALKRQLQQIDNFSLTVNAISVNAGTATAKVTSTYSGKNRTTTLTLVKEGSHWKIAGTANPLTPTAGSTGAPTTGPNSGSTGPNSTTNSGNTGSN